MSSATGTSAELWLIRHGESVGNRDRIYQGQNDLPLSPLGHEQAALLAQRLAPIHTLSPFCALYASDLQRAMETARPTAQAIGLPILPQPALREIDVGAWSGLTFADIQRRFPDEWAAAYPVMDPDQVRGGGESYRQAQSRTVAAVRAIAARHPGGRVLIFFHGGVLQTVLSHLMGLSLPNKRFLQTSNTSISRVRIADGNGAGHDLVLGMNDVAHLEQTFQTLAGVGPE
ncbi:MAG: phosphoglycerate mutase family protein [Caldilineaceae bacterium]|nr:phosphoglycerate mutase family protein [Caldilineaceae bacterium]